MIPDLYKDIKIQLYERAISPLLGSFVISWCLWNYKLFLVIFSSGTAFEKIARIEIILYPNFWWDGALVGLIYPLATTAFFIVVFPYPARLVFWITRYQQMKTKEVQQKIEDETPLTQEEAQEIRSNQRLLKRKHDEEITEKENEIVDRDATINKLDLEISACLENIIKAEEKADKLGKNYKLSEARAIKAEKELSRLQSLHGKSGQTESANDDSPNSESNDNQDWKEILGGLTNLAGNRRENAAKIMRDMLLDLNTDNRNRKYIDDKFYKHIEIVEYLLNTLKENNLVNYDPNNGDYYLSTEGVKLTVETLLE